MTVDTDAVAERTGYEPAPGAESDAPGTPVRSARRRRTTTVCQSQASSAATCETVRPPPTWTVAHLAALVVSTQFFAAMRWVSRTQLRFGHVAITQHMGCFFQASAMGVRRRQIDVVDHQALFDPGHRSAARAAHQIGHLLDHQLDVRSPALVLLVLEDRDVCAAHQGGEDLTWVDEDEGAACLLAHTASPKRLRPFQGDPRARCSPPESEEPRYFEAAGGIEPPYGALQAPA